MKKVLLASTALVFAGGMAMAEVETSGDGRMGIIGGNDADATFTSRIRIKFTGSGETDGGLTFGGSIRADNSGGASCVFEDVDGLGVGDVGFDISTADIDCSGTGGVTGQAGSVFAEGAFGRISMGDVDGAAENAVGDISGVGLTGLGYFNEFTYLHDFGEDPSVLYENSFGDFTVYLSADKPNVSENEVISVGASYGMGNYSFALGYESQDADGADSDHIIGGLTAGFGDATVKAIYGTADLAGADFDQWGVSIDYVFGATTATAFYRNTETAGVEVAGYGVGASYDLGGGASLKAGYVDTDALDEGVYDFGLSMSF